MKKLKKSFYLGSDVVALSRELLGKVLVTNFAGQITSGIITETEAYCAPEDKASHAYNNRRTLRTETMFAKGGVAYVYLCYGIHHLFNIVTGPKDTPHAILIRAVQPLDGIELMLQRRKMRTPTIKLTAGPGVLTQALGINRVHNGNCLLTSDLWIEDRGIKIESKQIIAATRIGIAYAGDYVSKPWRFYIKNNPWVSIISET